VERTAERGSLAQPVLAGVVTALVGFSSSFVLVLAGLRSVGASGAQAVSGLLLLSVGMGALAIWLGLRHRQPVSIAWSTPGAALLVASGVPAGGYRYAVGAFLVCGLLLTLTGLWSRLRELVTAIPAPLATALLAGVILPLCLAPVQAAVKLPALALPVIGVWAVLTRYARRWATPGAVATAVVVVLVHPVRQGGPALGLLPTVTVTAPGFSLAALVGIALPLYVITMASQNIPGIAVLRHFGYEPPVRAALTGAGLVSTAGALGGGFAVNLAAISAALAAGPDAGPDPKRRWVASVTAGGLYVVLGLSAGLAAALLTSAPPLLVEAAAGLALLPTLGSALASALGAPEHREAAVLTFAVTASGISAFGIGAPFWALLAGLLAYRLLPAATPAASTTPRVRG
jgi:benzoate membrane transport protein